MKVMIPIGYGSRSLYAGLNFLASGRNGMDEDDFAGKERMRKMSTSRAGILRSGHLRRWTRDG